MMDRNQVRVALLKILLMVLCGSTWLFWSFIFSTRPEQINEDTLSSLVRLPASLPVQLVTPTTKTLPPIEMSAVMVPCWDSPQTEAQATSARWVRLVGRSCKSTGQVWVENKSNGYVATVFDQQLGAKLTTDYIPLNQGHNEIIIRFEPEPGVQVENRFTLLKQ